jgi:hypothetical protein
MRYRIKAPEPGFNGESVGVTFTNGGGFVEDVDKVGRAALEYFRRHGYAVSPVQDQTDEATSQAAPEGSQESGTRDGDEPLLDPGEHSVDEVIEHLNGSDHAEALRVLDVEAAGKNRVTITKLRDEVLAAKAPTGNGDTT